MYFGVDYHPEQWVYPYAGSSDNPEAAWERDAQMMASAGINVVRIGEFTWGICEPEEGKCDFSWLGRVMDIMVMSMGFGLMQRSAKPGRATREIAMFRGMGSSTRALSRQT